MKICNKCNIEKSLDEFVFDNSKKLYTPSCRLCRSMIQKQKRAANLDEYNSKITAWRNRTLDRQKENRLAWKQNNRDKINELARLRWKKMVDDKHLEHFLNNMEEENTHV